MSSMPGLDVGLQGIGRRAVVQGRDVRPSMGHSSEYPLPLKMMRLWSLKTSRQMTSASASIIRGGLETIGIFSEALGHGGVEHRVGRRQVELASRHAELEAVAGKGKRRRAITVGVVLLERGKHLAAQVHAPPSCARRRPRPPRWRRRCS